MIEEPIVFYSNIFLFVLFYIWVESGVCRFTREVVQKRRALISQQTKTDTDVSTAPRRKKDFVDIILLSKVGEEIEITRAGERERQ